MDNGTRAHTLVAYENLLLIASAAYSVSKERGESFAIEDFIPQIGESLDNKGGDEVNSRRFAWFLYAALLGRLEKLALTNKYALKSGAKIWCLIATSAPILKGALPHNVVWKEDEKERYDLSLSDDKLVERTINHAMPPIFANDEIVQRFAKERGLFYWPSKSRIGIMP